MKLGRYLIGLVSGLTFGMLFAPKKGKELRKAITKKSETDSTEALKVLGRAYQTAWNDVVSEAKKLKDSKQVSAAFDTFQDKFNELLNMAEERGGEVAEVAQKKVEEMADLATSKAKKFKKRAVKKVATTKKKVVKKAKGTVKKAVKKVTRKRK